jgi:hypothetical protein
MRPKSLHHKVRTAWEGSIVFETHGGELLDQHTGPHPTGRHHDAEVSDMGHISTRHDWSLRFLYTVK